MNIHHRQTTLFSLFIFFTSNILTQTINTSATWFLHHKLYSGSKTFFEKNSVQFSQDGAIFSIKSPSLGLDVWGPPQFKISDYQGPVFITKIPFLQIESISSIALTNQHYAIGTYNGTLFVYEYSTRPTIKPTLKRAISITDLTHKQPHSFAYNMTFSRDKKFLIIGDNHGNVIRWNYITNEYTRYKALNNPIEALITLPDNENFIAGDLNKFIHMNFVDPKNKWLVFFGSKEVTSITISPSGQYIGLIIKNQFLQLINIKRNTSSIKCLHTNKEAVEQNLSKISFSHDDTYCFCGNSEGKLFAISTKTLETTCMNYYTSSIASVACSPNGKWIVTSSYAREVTLLYTKEKENITEALQQAQHSSN